MRVAETAHWEQLSNDSRRPQPTNYVSASRRCLAKQRRITATLARFDSLPDDALVEIGIVSIVLGRSPASIWRDVAAGRLAKPVRVGLRSTRWRIGDLRASTQEA